MELSAIKNNAKINLMIALTAVLFTLLNSCKGSLQPAFSGTYINSAASEASIASDTLILELDQANSFFIHRRTGFQLLDDSGKLGALQHETEEWKAVYDPQTEVMTESRSGKLITFDISNGTMTVSKRKYKKIK